jgi:hypothetical protein
MGVSSPCCVVPQEHVRWFTIWMISFTAVFILYLRVMCGSPPSHEALTVLSVLVKGVFSSCKCLFITKLVDTNCEVVFLV